MEEIIRATNVKHVYPDGTLVYFRGQDFVVKRGEAVAVLGPNGCGKTTLFYHLMGLLEPAEGTVVVFGHDPAKEFEAIRERIGVLLQDPGEQIIAPTVREDIAFSPRNYGYGEEEVRRMVEEVSGDLEIVRLLDKVPHYLSGGERLKVALAGALVLRPQLLVLDEPFEGLDNVSKIELITVLNHLHDHGLALVLSTHEVNLVPYFAETIYLLSRGGEITDKGSVRKILGDRQLLEAHHLQAPVLSRLFDELRSRGIDLGMALTVDEAVEILEQAMMPMKARRRKLA